jgi:hypothetical protein
MWKRYTGTVPRSKEPDGKRVTICSKISEGDAAIVDTRCAARGLTRSAWLQSLIAADLALVSDSGTAINAPAESPPKRQRRSAPALPVAEPSPKPRTAAKTGCSHRLPKDAYCRVCERIKD